MTTDLDLSLRNAVGLRQPNDLYILVDNNSQTHCLQFILKTLPITPEHTLCLPSGEENKSLCSVEKIWQFLISQNATRQSLLLILGGGVLSDMGGFAASTFKRGIPFVNIPTTLLAMVDAAQGGKTGFDYQGLKNEIGLFMQPKDIIIDPIFLRTLPYQDLISGYAEMVKHALIASPLELIPTLAFDFNNIDWEIFTERIQRSIDIKQYIVEQDPEEKGLRKSLNFGHTIGHALEEYSIIKSQEVASDSTSNMQSSLPHGYAVMYGIVAELYLSVIKLGFPQSTLNKVVHFMTEHYGKPTCPCKDYNRLFALMQHDKKNEIVNGEPQINFSLLRNVGNCHINQHCTNSEITEALDFLFNI